MGCGLDELLSLADSWLDDLRALSHAFFHECEGFFAREHALNPVFTGSGLIGGADADFIVDHCLFEVKTSIRPVLRSTYLWQLVGYVLLDFDNEFLLEEVALYWSRQARLIHWPLKELMDELAGDGSSACSST